MTTKKTLDLSNEDDIKEFEKIIKESGDEYYTDEDTGRIYPFYKENKTDKIWWVDTYDIRDGGTFSFDKKTTYSLFGDYPHNLTPEQKEIFDKENPYWADFFGNRPYNQK